MSVVRTVMMPVQGGELPVTLSRSGKEFVVSVDGVEWVRTENRVHAVVLLEMMVEHLTKTWRGKAAKL